MGCKNKQFSDLDMGGSVHSKSDALGDILARQRLDAFIDVVCALFVAMETNDREIGLDQTGFDVGHAHAGMGHVDAQAVAQGLHGRLGGTIDVTAGIGSIAGHAADVHHMSAIALHHARHDEACHRQQTFDVGVNHRVPILVVSLIFGLKAPCAASIVDQHIDFLPLGRQTLDGGSRCLTVPDIELKRYHPDTQSRQLLCKSIQTVGLATSNNHVVANHGQFARAGLSDTACRASH